MQPPARSGVRDMSSLANRYQRQRREQHGCLNAHVGLVCGHCAGREAELLFNGHRGGQIRSRFAANTPHMGGRAVGGSQGSRACCMSLTCRLLESITSLGTEVGVANQR